MGAFPLLDCGTQVFRASPSALRPKESDDMELRGSIKDGSRWHRQAFCELQGELPVEIVFVLTVEQADALMAKLREAKVELFWVRMPAEFDNLSGSGV